MKILTHFSPKGLNLINEISFSPDQKWNLQAAGRIQRVKNTNRKLFRGWVRFTDHPEWGEQEVEQIHGARVLNVILQLRLQITESLWVQTTPVHFYGQMMKRLLPAGWRRVWTSADSPQTRPHQGASSAEWGRPLVDGNQRKSSDRQRKKTFHPIKSSSYKHLNQRRKHFWHEKVGVQCFINEMKEETSRSQFDLWNSWELKHTSNFPSVYVCWWAAWTTFRPSDSFKSKRIWKHPAAFAVVHAGKTISCSDAKRESHVFIPVD